MPPTRPSCSNAPSATILLKLLQQLSLGPALASPSSSRASIPILDCLLPRFSSQPFTLSRSRTYSTHSASTTAAGRASIPRHNPTTHTRTKFRTPLRWQQTPSLTSTRTLSTTPRRRRTVPFFNPPDEPSVLEITPRAATRLVNIAEKDQNPNLALRIQVESGGCHGFQYLMSLVTLPDDLSSAPTSAAVEEGDKNAVREDDAVFSFVDDSVREGSAEEVEQRSRGAKIILDGPSLHLLQGSKVDFTQELIGSQFKIIDNPRATSSCGCGTSFDIKLD